jgi:hypothetical protein
MLDPLRLDDDVDSINSGADSTNSRLRYVFEDEANTRPGRGWLRISDDAVAECGIETVLQEGVGAFMLYYERAVQETSGVYSSLNNGKANSSSEETLKPELTLNMNGSVGSLVNEIGVGVQSTTRLARSYSQSRDNAQKHPLKDPFGGDLKNGIPSSFSSSSLLSSSPSSSSSSLPPLSSPIPLQPLQLHQPNGTLSSSLSLSSSRVNASGARIVRNVTTSKRGGRSRSVTSDGTAGSTESNASPLVEMESRDYSLSKKVNGNGNAVIGKERVVVVEEEEDDDSLSVSMPAIAEHSSPVSSSASSPASSPPKKKSKSKSRKGLVDSPPASSVSNSTSFSPSSPTSLSSSQHQHHHQHQQQQHRHDSSSTTASLPHKNIHSPNNGTPIVHSQAWRKKESSLFIYVYPFLFSEQKKNKELFTHHFLTTLKFALSCFRFVHFTFLYPYTYIVALFVFCFLFTPFIW